MTGMDTAPMMPSIMSGSLIRATPPWARMSAGTRSSAMTATAPASSAILACSGVTTSMITPPLSISAMPRLTRAVPTTGSVMLLGWSCSGTANSTEERGQRPSLDREAGRYRVVDLDHRGHDRVTREPGPSNHRLAPHPDRGGDGVVVEPPGELHPGARLGQQVQRLRGQRRGVAQHGHLGGVAERDVQGAREVVLDLLGLAAGLEPLGFR